MTREEPLSRLVLDPPSRTTNAQQVARLVAAARRCFARDGVSRTRMKHVAEEADIVRQTAYEFVSGLPELVELALLERARELAVVAAEQVGRGPRHAADALVEHIAVLTETCRDDAEFVTIAEALSRGPALRFLAASSRVQAIYGDALRPRYDQARRQGVLRTDVSDDEITAWVQNCTTPLASRWDLDATSLRLVIRRFLLPALVAPPT